jgi:putative oxidoreductase
MNMLHRFELWGEMHHPKWADFIRIALGGFLVYTGIIFFTHINDSQSSLLTGKSFASFNAYMFYLTMGFVHFAGGLLLILGVLTRFACLVQIPFLLAGMFFTPYAPVLITLVVILLLLYFLVAGNGPISVSLPSDDEQR